ncbi:MAG: peptidase M23 [Flavobacterium sp. BFFFF2]|nr:MAG: peptidase M23 [Flavobacterium sp. BFFFF2]
MKERKTRRKQIKKRLFTKNRLVILNEDTFEELFSFRLTLMNVFVAATVGAVLIIFCTTFIIAFTPLREYIPGYASTQLKKDATELALQSDSLVVAVTHNDAYLQSIKDVLNGKVQAAKWSKDSIRPSEIAEVDPETMVATDEEKELRETVDKEDRYNVFEKAVPKVKTVFFAPVKGIVTEGFNPKKKHLAVDIALPKNTAIKAILNGTVLFADWTPDFGNVLILRHNNGFISVYKHTATLESQTGDVVKTGEVIALAGATGMESTGIHLHFELWKEGYPIDPSAFITFE